MSVSIYFAKVNKRRNSTLQATFSTSFDCVLKQATSIDRPTFILESASFDYNLAKWDDRYYFVDNVVSVKNNIWEVSCVLDVLATYKSYILNTTAYVLYDTVANTELPDNRLPIKTTKSVSASTAACPFVPDGGCYILSLTGSHDTTGVYKVSESELAALIDDLSYILDDIFDVYNNPPAQPTYTNDVAQNIKIAANYFVDDLQWRLDCLRKPITQIFGSGNIPQNIRECRYLPFDVGVTGASNQIYLGTFETQQSLSKLLDSNPTVHRTATVSIPWQASDFRRRSPYTDIYLYLPYIGMIRLSSENLVGQSSLTVAYTLAVRDGSLVCTVSSGSEIIGQYHGNVSASVPVGISNIGLSRTAQSILTGVAGVASKNIGVIGMAALNFADSVTPNYSSIGGLDGIASVGANQNITCYTVFHDTIVAPNTDIATIGAPSMCPKSLGSLTGFCQCLDAHVSAPAQLSELALIDTYLNSGFYIE